MTASMTTRWNWMRLLLLLLLLDVTRPALAGKIAVPTDHADFGLPPDALVIGTLTPTGNAGTSLRDQLVNEGVLDNETFASTSATRTVPKTGTKPGEVEELSAPPKSDAPSSAEPDREPPKQPTLAEKINYRYSDPRNVRLLDQLTARSAEQLYVEIAQMIDTRHIQPTSYATRVNDAFEHLAMALHSTPFRQATRLKADDQSLTQLERSLSQMQRRTSVRTLDEAVTAMNRVSDLFNKYAQIQPGAVGLEFVYAELDTLDRFSSLIPPEKVGGPTTGLKDNVVGIGVEIEAHPDGLKVLKVLPGGPAAEVQIRRGDVLTAIDQQPIKGLELNRAADLILGEPGTPLRLNLIRNGRRGDVTLIRRRVALHAVASRMLDDKRKVAYIKLDTFSDSSVRELDDALMSMHNAGMKSLVLDLRGNPGGLLTAAIAISDRFLPTGTIVSTKGRTAADNTKEQAHYGETWKVPLVVLIDRNSASASEILAAAIQENGRGLIVGERSYGKGTVQTLFPLQSASAGLRLTTAKFYSPDGRAMAGAGVTPDLKVDASIGDDADNDAAINAALRLATDSRLRDMANRLNRTGEAPRIFRMTL
jgi:carboxyl-terminal processing protease